MASGAAGGNVSRGTASKSLTINEYKRRLKDSIRSINENFALLLQAAKVFRSHNTVTVENMSASSSTFSKNTISASLTDFLLIQNFLSFHFRIGCNLDFLQLEWELQFFKLSVLE